MAPAASLAVVPATPAGGCAPFGTESGSQRSATVRTALEQAAHLIRTGRLSRSGAVGGFHTLNNYGQRIARGLSTFVESLTPSEFTYWLGTQLCAGSTGTRYQELGEQLQEQSCGSELRCLTLNVWGLAHLSRHGLRPERFRQIAAALRQGRYDVVTLQEMWHPSTRTIIEDSGMPYVVSAGSSGGLIGRSGLVTLSRFPVLDHRFVPFRRSVGVERLVQKGVLSTRIAHPGFGPIDVLNVHLLSEPERLNRFLVDTRTARRVRRDQILQVREELNLPGSSLSLLMGDLNIDDTDSDYAILPPFAGTDVFRDHWNLGDESEWLRTRGDGFTFDPERNPFALHRWKRRERIDHVWVRASNPRAFVYRARLRFTENPLSDHFGVDVSLRSLRGDDV